MPSLLLEIGAEELPAALAPAALAQLLERLPALLHGQRLAHGDAAAFGTPRRLAVRVADVADRQEDTEEWVRGPSKTVGFGPDGQPSRAALGFARSQGVEVAQLVEREGYLYGLKRTPGRSAAEVLAQVLPGLIAGIDFPRSMRWGDGDLRFARPIRWIVALLDSATIPFVLGDVTSGGVTHGHRTLAPGPVEVASPPAYEEVMAQARVMADPSTRAEAIRSGVLAAAQGKGGVARIDPGLLAEVTWLVEYPTPFCGAFPEEALAVPEPVLVEVMRVQQRYFPVQGAEGRLMPLFCGVRDGDEENLDTVIAGNERVLRARFADARFFYDEDRKRTLASRVPELERVTFAEGLGTMAAKAMRLQQLVTGPILARAAQLCKADRLTHLVGEFPELEGTMGAHYAQLDGEPAEVCQAIADHVLPRAAAGDLPQSEAGRILAIADRLDNLAGHFLLGRAPTGSADPFGLRRQAIAVLRLERQGGRDLRQALRAALAGYVHVGDPAVAEPALLHFLRERLRGLMTDAGHRYDAVEAVLAVDEWRIGELWSRVAALQGVLADAKLADDFLTVYRRCANLATKAEPGSVYSPQAATAPEESRLGELLQAAPRRPTVTDHAQAVAMLRSAVDELLDKVLIMAPEPEVRRNRLALLRDIAAFAATYADLGRVVQ
ncbi:MAG TPA: glycine--tRNA ligase subunit beta [Bacillota bacterium]|nr:glycine--tRNA ligase subunit beta [Bacillota bacterium]